jgi:hypothetical protein
MEVIYGADKVRSGILNRELLTRMEKTLFRPHNINEHDVSPPVTRESRGTDPGYLSTCLNPSEPESDGITITGDDYLNALTNSEWSASSPYNDSAIHEYATEEFQSRQSPGRITFHSSSWYALDHLYSRVRRPLALALSARLCSSLVIEIRSSEFIAVRAIATRSPTSSRQINKRRRLLWQ